MDGGFIDDGTYTSTTRFVDTGASRKCVVVIVKHKSDTPISAPPNSDHLFITQYNLLGVCGIQAKAIFDITAAHVLDRLYALSLSVNGKDPQC